MDMAGKSTNAEPQKGGEDPLNYHTPNMSSSEWQVGVNNLTNSSVIGMIPMGNSMVDSSACSSGHMADSFHPPIWDQPINGQGLGIFLPPGMLPQFPADSGFIERAARFSCFGEMMSPFGSIHDHPLNPPYSSRGPGPMVVRGPHEGFERGPHEGLVGGPHEEVAKRGVEGSDDEAEFSGRGGGGGGDEFSGKGAGGGKKRKRGGGPNSENEENNEAAKTASIETVKETEEIKRTSDQNPSSAGKSGGKNGKQGGSQSSDPPKEDYIHIRARRGQATNSHSLAERVRREKISERMKFLQDLVPGCSKVTGKAVMLDEIINYVQSLQRQVEFLSMKLATVNPRLDFNIEGLLAKDPRGGGISSSSSMVFPTDMTMPFLPIHPSQIQACHPSNSSESLRRTINLQSTAIVIGGFKESTSSQVPSVWEDELHNVVHMGFNSSTPPNIQDLSGSLPPGHMKAEP